MSQNRQQYPDEERQTSLRRAIQELFQRVIQSAGDLSGKLSGEPGNMAHDCLILRKQLTALLLYTSHDKTMEKGDKASILAISRFLALRVPSINNDGRALTRYARHLLKCVDWYTEELVQTGTIIVEQE